MDVKKIIGILLAGLMFFTMNAAYALECDVKYTAKLVKKDPRWFGAVEKPKFKFGIRPGTGSNETRCVSNALRKIKKEVEKDGWKVTGYRLVSISK